MADNERVVRDADLPHAVIRFTRTVNLPRFNMAEGERWGFVVYGKTAVMVEAIKAGQRFEFAGGQCLAEDVELIYEGPGDLEWSRAAGYLNESAVRTSRNNLIWKPAPLPSGSGFFLGGGKVNDMKERIISALARLGWQKDSIVDAFSKTFETVVAPKRASIWLRLDGDGDRWWLTDGDFTSAGENVLAATYAILAVGMADSDVERAIATLVEEMERKIAEAYSVRLLRNRE